MWVVSGSVMRTLAAEEEVVALRMLQLKKELDPYHQRRADKHGWLYVQVRPDDEFNLFVGIYEARSIATGVVCTLDAAYVEEGTSALQEPQGS